MKNSKRKLVLGIDAGGTFTDLVLYSKSDNQIVKQAKVQTKHHYILSTIENGVEKIMKDSLPDEIVGINLATTFATNAIVEEKFQKSGLILIGYKQRDLDIFLKDGGQLGTDLYAIIPGGHDNKGIRQENLDEKELLKQVSLMKDKVDSIGISGYFSVNNPEHELRASQLIKKHFPHIYISTGHEISSRLNAFHRAASTALNAGLIPLILNLFRAIEKLCRDKGINAPMSIVRGDGSLVSEDWAKNHPIEMILSGPAASAVGARTLANIEQNDSPSWVVDIGGTTTDIIPLKSGGRVALSPSGAEVGKYKTLVTAIDIHTFGQGGDSKVYLDKHQILKVGPNKILPICAASSAGVPIKPLLETLLSKAHLTQPIFVLLGENKAPENTAAARIQSLLQDGPLTLVGLTKKVNILPESQVKELEIKGYITLCGFTPTDAMHTLGLFEYWDKEASHLAANVYGKILKNSGEDFALATLTEVSTNISSEIFMKNLFDSYPSFEKKDDLKKLIRLATFPKNMIDGRLILDLNSHLIGVGAPSSIIMPEVGNCLSQTCILPKGAEVAGAVGAASGSFSLNYVIEIKPDDEYGYRIHHPLGVSYYEELDVAIEETHALMIPWLETRSKNIGAQNPKITFHRKDINVRDYQTANERLFFSCELLYVVSDEKVD